MKYLFLVSFILLLFTSCNVFIVNKTRLIKNTNGTPQFYLAKNDTLIFKSISVINRMSSNFPLRILSGFKVDTSINNNFEEIIKHIESLNKNGNYHIKFLDSISLKNDSLFKPLLNDKTFRNSFQNFQIQRIDFSKMLDGNYLFITVFKERDLPFGWNSAGGNTGMHLCYEFLNIENGKVKNATTINRLRLSTYPVNGDRWKPIPRDTRRVFKKLYKLKE